MKIGIFFDCELDQEQAWRRQNGVRASHPIPGGSVWVYKNRDFLLVLFPGRGHIASTSEPRL